MDLKEQNILYLTRAPIHGGTENVIVQLCEIFHNKVNKIVVCAGNGFKNEKLKELGIKYYCIPDIENKNIETIIEVSKILNKVIKKENITVIHTHHRMAAFYVTFLKLYKGRIFLNTSHNTFNNKRLLTRYSYKNATLIACGEAVKKNLEQVFNIKECYVVHNAIKAFDFQKKECLEIKKFRKQNRILISNVSRLSPQKGLEYFIEAADIVKNTHKDVAFLIVGDGELEKSLKEKVEKLKLDDYVFFLGYRDDIQNFMSQTDFVVLSSLWEGLPLTPIEAFSVGKTIVATDVDGTGEIVRNKNNGLLVPPYNSLELAKAINFMIENDRTEFEKNAYDTFLNEFSFEIFSKRYINIYKEAKV